VKHLLPWIVLLFSALAYGQPAAEPDPREHALELGREALELYNQQRWVDAYERFERAEREVHSPAFVLYMARAQSKLGAPARARDLYRRVIDEPLGADAPDAWREAQEEARAEIDAVQARIPRLRLQITGPTGALEVWLNARLLTQNELQGALEAEPGTYRLVVRRDGAEVVRRPVRLVEGREESIAIVLPPTPAPPAYPVVKPPPPPPNSYDETRSGLRVAAITAFVLGGVLTVTGIALGIVAVDMDSQLETLCPDRRCGAGLEEDVSDYRAAANAATGTLIAGGVLFAAGITMISLSVWRTAPEKGASITLRGAF
jgi:hypothetical protein